MELSRSCLLLIALPVALCCAGSVQAQETPGGDTAEADRRAAQMLLTAKSAYAPDAARRKCREAVKSGEIVVCAEDGEKFRVPSTSESDPRSSQALNDGQIRPPNMEKQYPGIVAAKGCFVPPCPPPPAYFIDLSSIPEAPAGSDADKVAKGEMRDR